MKIIVYLFTMSILLTACKTGDVSVLEMDDKTTNHMKPAFFETQKIN